jgi:mannose-1-phosphate guanylyltransferase
VKGNFKWDDIGTWDSLDRIMEKDEEGNIIQSEFLGIDVKNSIIFGGKPIIGLGIENLVVIDTEDCIFVSNKDRAEEIKAIVSKLGAHPSLNSLLNYS